MNKVAAIELLRGKIRLKHLAYSTEQAYCGWVSRYCDFVAGLGPALTSEQKVEAFLSSMARGGCSAVTQNQAFHALLFFYETALGRPLEKVDALRAKRPSRTRECPSRVDVSALLGELRESADCPARLLAGLLYGAGLRVCEALELRVKDVRLADSELVIRDPKHGHDRLVPIPCCLVPALRRQLEAARVVWQRDLVASPQLPVALPELLAKKYPRARFAWAWAWLFPAGGWCVHPRTGERVRWRLHEASVQRVFREAAERLAVAGRPLSVPITPHVLRHGFATHFAGDIRDLQAILGHKSLETTATYRHPELHRAGSPLEELMAGASLTGVDRVLA